MSLKEQVVQDLKSAMLARDNVKTRALRMLKAAITNLEITKKGSPLTDADILSVIQKQITQRRDSIEQYKKGQRDDLVRAEEAEIAALGTYVPPQLDDAKLENAVQEITSEHGFQTKKDFGKAMKVLQEKLQGQADNKRISAALNKLLS